MVQNQNKIEEYSLSPTPFLREVAAAYVANSDADELASICFVTPNKRSGVFLSKHIADEMRNHNIKGFAPAVVPISDFIAEFTDEVEASRIEQLFILYNSYSEVLHKHMTPDESAAGKGQVDFNRFQYWGDILLNDFNDVDRDLVDAKMLFKNVSDLKEISSNFLTPEQIEVIKRYWNEELVPEPVQEFWRHVVHSSDNSDENGENNSDNKKNIAGFVKLWQVMYEIYISYRKSLTEKGFTYSGKSYRDALEKISKANADDFEYDLYVFVGFNVLSKSEQAIFRTLQKLGIADFYWDYASPAFKVRSNRASRFMKNNVKEFPSRYKGIGTTIDYCPNINCINIPSTFGQAKLIPEIIEDLHPKFFNPEFQEIFSLEQNQDELDELVDTAIVLPDENLIHPILASIPECIPSVNVTMGFSLRHTEIASLIGKIISLQLRAREAAFDNTFFYEDVVAILSHPLIRLTHWQTCDDIIAYISRGRLFNIPASKLLSDEFAPLHPIFKVVSNATDSEAVIGYLSDLLNWLLATLKNLDNNGYRAAELDIQYVMAYLDAINELNRLRRQYINFTWLEDKTVFHLVERIVGNQKINYEGVPLAGLQAMGVLESRCLDFPNIIITSMNERVFPRRHYSKSFIPNALRKGYGMSTVEHQESIYAYYFYRLISRARNVYLLYDGRTTGVRSGGPSRFINQLRYNFPTDKYHSYSSSYKFMPLEEKPLSAPKSPQTMKLLEAYKSEVYPRYLSASSINSYINCPMQFYLSQIEGYYQESDPAVDYMDDSTYGTILHDVLQRMYDDAKGNADCVEINDDLLDRLSNEDLVKKYVTEAIRHHYLKDEHAQLFGDSAMYLTIMTKTVLKLFERERELPKPLYYLKGEESVKTRVEISDRHTINLKYIIDRVDRFYRDNQECIRLIDYKTGGDEISANTVEQLFSNAVSGSKSRPKAILQLMLYANAYAQDAKFEGPIQPFIYKLRTLAIDPHKPIEIAKEPIEDFREINDEFLDYMNNLLDELFDPEKPFEARPGEHTCKYCKFTEICPTVGQQH